MAYFSNRNPFTITNLLFDTEFSLWSLDTLHASQITITIVISIIIIFIIIIIHNNHCFVYFSINFQSLHAYFLCMRVACVLLFSLSHMFHKKCIISRLVIVHSFFSHLYWNKIDENQLHWIYQNDLFICFKMQ